MMHLNRGSLLVCFFILLCFICCEPEPEIVRQVNLLVQKERHDSDTLYNKFKQYGVQAIPYLIDAIDEDEKGYVGFGDPKSSYIYPYNFNYVGIRAAYLIEFILADTNEVRLYHYGVIERKGMDPYGRDSLSINDMKAIKASYTKWWEGNRQQPFEKLNQEWKRQRGELILNNGNYFWR